MLGGDESALAELDRASDVLRAEGVRFDLALLLRSRAMLAPDDPGAQAAAEEARGILTDLGAVTLLRGLPDTAGVAPEGDPKGQPLAPAPTDPGTTGVVSA